MKGLDQRTPQVSIQAKIIFVDRTDIEQLGVKYDFGSTTQFFNKLIQRPDPRTAEPVDTDLDGVPDALVPKENFPANENIVSLGGNSLSALGNAAQEVVNPALDLIFSTAIGNFDLTAFVQALQSVELADIQAEPTITTLDNRQAEILVGDRVPIRVIDVSAVAGGGTGGTVVPRATVTFQQTGINLRVTPHVTGTRQILMEVHAERSNVRPASVDIGFTFQTQQADNQILVGDGETAVIGGLTVTEVTVSKTGIPFLVDLPILGKLFGFTNQQENRRDRARLMRLVGIRRGTALLCVSALALAVWACETARHIGGIQADTQKPAIALSNTAGDTQDIAGGLRFNVSAVDNLALKSVDLTFSGGLIGTLDTTFVGQVKTYAVGRQLTFSSSSGAGGNITIIGRATDGAGNFAEDTISIFLSNVQALQVFLISPSRIPGRAAERRQ